MAGCGSQIVTVAEPAACIENALLGAARGLRRRIPRAKTNSVHARRPLARCRHRPSVPATLSPMSELPEARKLA